MQAEGRGDGRATRHRADHARRSRTPRPRLRTLLGRLARDTFASCMKYRVTGLAAEAAFFSLLSLPPLALGLAGVLGYLDGLLGHGTIDHIQSSIISASGTVLSHQGEKEVVQPLLDSVFKKRQPGLISLGFVFALWSGSRAVNVFVDTITIMYGLSGHRGIVRTRTLSFSLYIVALIIGSVVLPLVVGGPDLIIKLVPQLAGTVHVLYWPVAIGLCVILLTTLYHLSVPVRTAWKENLPGALFALLIWVLGSLLLRTYLVHTVEGPTVYGSLAAPVAVLLWMGVTALAVLIGAAMNASVDRVWPSVATAQARAERERDEQDAAKALVAQYEARRSSGELDEDTGMIPLVRASERTQVLPVDEPGEPEDAPAEFPERWDPMPPHGLRAQVNWRVGRRRGGQDRHDDEPRSHRRSA